MLPTLNAKYTNGDAMTAPIYKLVTVDMACLTCKVNCNIISYIHYLNRAHLTICL